LHGIPGFPVSCNNRELFQHLLRPGWVLLVICWPVRLVNSTGNVSPSSPTGWLEHQTHPLGWLFDLQQVLRLSHCVYCQVAVSTGCYQESAMFYSTLLKFLYLGLFRSSDFLELSFILHMCT
jgi:hypothetical protein